MHTQIFIAIRPNWGSCVVFHFVTLKKSVRFSEGKLLWRLDGLARRSGSAGSHILSPLPALHADIHHLLCHFMQPRAI